MTIKDRILIVDDEPSIAEGIAALLDPDWETRTAESGRAALVAVSEFSPDVVLLDVNLPDFTGIDLLQQIKSYSEATAVIMMSGQGTFDTVVESMKLGAETFLQKPFDYATLGATLAHVQKLVATQRELYSLRRSDMSGERLAGVSAAVTELNSILGDVARAPSPVLIQGESGTGKGVIARLIHNRSARAKAPFVDLNCAGLSKELLESELFGHERGAFTNAMNTKPGLFEIAGAGTLFLDEIGEMELTVQARLLKALEEKRFRRVGGVRDLHAGFRLLAATNRDLAAEVSAGRFRADLYYRLNVVRLRLPALRERMDDMPILVSEIVRPLAKEMGKPIPRVSGSGMKKLMSYAWPGNVRELRNVLERAMITLRGAEIRSEDLVLESGANSAIPREKLGPSEEWEIQPLDDVVSSYVSSAVDAVDGNVRKAARLLQISPSTLYSKLKK